MPTSASAMRTGWLPSRGSGVTVLVTNASSSRATSGAVSASRQPLALSSRMEHRPFHAEALEHAVDLDRAAVAGAVAAGHRRLPRKLGIRRQAPHRLEHRLRAAGEHVVARRQHFGHERRLDDDLRVRDERSGLRVPRATEAENRRRPAQRLRQVRERRDADPATDEQWAFDVEAKAVAEWADDGQAIAGLERAQRPGP